MALLAVDIEAVHDVVRRHCSTGRALLYAMAGPLDVETSADGGWVVGASGRRYLDLGSFAVFLLGHRHPRVVDAVAAQLQRLPGSSRAFPSESHARALAAVAGLAPPGLSKVMLLNSGAEAVEAGVKLARVATGRSGLHHLEGSFHGKTAGALSLTDASLFREPFLPLLPGITRLSRTDAEEAAAAIRAERPAAVILEPVQGEGGVFELSVAYLRAVRDACSAAGAVLVADEIQCGLGRTGHLRAMDFAGVVPDVLLLGKGLGGGVVPVSALVARPEVFEPFDRDPLLHSSTFGGNPLASAAVAATGEVIQADDIPGRAARLGVRVRALLDALVLRWPELFTRVTGRGLLLGLHCRRPGVAGQFIRSCLAHGLLVTPCLTRPS
ncbi:MAG TPA: aminotransferase class III-fold pyridoxal phosphate-dependent enzyme, partial [Methylomirabilota bacterium]|nr:aminotransferase class III-fold pyridoxal phosphate-dependent enzyme [Methylomirabilota bacterium]